MSITLGDINHTDNDISTVWNDGATTTLSPNLLEYNTSNVTDVFQTTFLDGDMDYFMVTDRVQTDVDNVTDYVYDYNYNESVNYVPLDELVPNAVVYGLTFLLGLVGNVLVIISVARYKRMQNVTNIFLLSLATADLLLVLICVPVKVRRPPVHSVSVNE